MTDAKPNLPRRKTNPPHCLALQNEPKVACHAINQRLVTLRSEPNLRAQKPGVRSAAKRTQSQ